MQTVDQTAGQETNAVISDYERERDKSTPNYAHGVIQANISGSLYAQAGVQYRIASEVTSNLMTVWF